VSDHGAAHGRCGLAALAAWPPGLTTEWPPRDRSQRVPPQQDAILDNSLLGSAELSAEMDQDRCFSCVIWRYPQVAISSLAPLGFAATH
jgi:hypothetical protein